MKTPKKLLSKTERHYHGIFSDLAHQWLSTGVPLTHHWLTMGSFLRLVNNDRKARFILPLASRWSDKRGKNGHTAEKLRKAARGDAKRRLANKSHRRRREREALSWVFNAEFTSCVKTVQNEERRCFLANENK